MFQIWQNLKQKQIKSAEMIYIGKTSLLIFSLSQTLSSPLQRAARAAQHAVECGNKKVTEEKIRS